MVVATPSHVNSIARVDPRVPWTPIAGEYSDFDLLRVAGMVAVVLLHISLGLIHYRDLNPQDMRICLAINALTWWAVPVFVMMSGALVLDPRRWTTVGAFYRRRLARIGWPMVFWCGFYLAWPFLFAKAGANRFPDMRQTRGWQGLWLGAPYYHLHFMFIIAGLYVVTPLLIMGLRRWGRAFSWAGMLGGFIAAAIASWAMALADYRPNLLIRFLPFVPYFLAGVCLKEVVLSRRALAVVLVLAVGLILAEIQLLSWARREWIWLSHDKAVAHYLSPPVIGLAIALFLAARTLGSTTQTPNPETVQRWQLLAGTSFGVYLIHPLILDLLARLTHDGARLASPCLVEIGAGTMSTLVLSYLATRLLQRWPATRRLVG